GGGQSTDMANANNNQTFPGIAGTVDVKYSKPDVFNVVAEFVLDCLDIKCRKTCRASGTPTIRIASPYPTMPTLQESPRPQTAAFDVGTLEETRRWILTSREDDNDLSPRSMPVHRGIRLIRPILPRYSLPATRNRVSDRVGPPASSCGRT